MTFQTNNKLRLSLLVTFFLGVGFAMGIYAFGLQKTETRQQPRTTRSITGDRKTTKRDHPAPDPLKLRIEKYLSARPGQVGVFLELEGGPIVSVDGSIQFPTASLIKVPIAIATYHEANLGKIELQEKLRVPEIDHGFGGQVFRPGTMVDVEDLLRYMLSESDNAAANALIDRLGTERINEISAKLGARRTTLRRKMLDLESISVGIENLSTPQDMVLLLKKVVDHRGFEEKYGDAIMNNLSLSRDHRMIAALSSATVIHKTGTVESADGFTLGDVAMIVHNKKRAFLAIMAAKQPTENDGIETIQRVAEIIFEAKDE